MKSSNLNKKTCIVLESLLLKIKMFNSFSSQECDLLFICYPSSDQFSVLFGYDFFYHLFLFISNNKISSLNKQLVFNETTKMISIEDFPF